MPLGRRDRGDERVEEEDLSIKISWREQKQTSVAEAVVG